MSIRFGEDAVFSFPVLTNRGGVLADAMFLFREGQPNGQISRPFGWMLLGSATGEILLLCDCRVNDFLSPERFPKGEPIPFQPGKYLDHKEYNEKYQRLYQVYEQLRLFAFEPDPADWQIEIMLEYHELLSLLAGAGHMAFYQQLSPEFFMWLNLENTGPVEGEEPPAQETAEATPPQEAPEEPPEENEAAQPASSGEIMDALRILEQKFEEKIARDQHKEALFDEMHNELVEYKNGLLGALSEPLERDVIKVIDDVTRTLEAWRGKQPTKENYMRFFTLLEGVKTDLTDLLYRQGVEPFRVEGENVEILRQQVLATLPTEDAGLDKKTAERHGVGWEKAGKILRPERISVYVYRKDGDE